MIVVALIYTVKLVMIVIKMNDDSDRDDYSDDDNIDECDSTNSDGNLT